MQFEIPRLAAGRIQVQEFLEQYYDSEKPVIITGVVPPDGNLVQDMLADKNVRPGTGFVGAMLDTTLQRLEVPELVKVVLARDDVVIRARPLRLWMQSKGHRTMLHYDGNSLHGLNWQVTGKKQWTLISPDTPPPFYPFHPYTMTEEKYSPDAARHDFCEFTTMPGDLLFVPRYWLHEVTALDHHTTNINWVWTPRIPNLQVKVGRRECAVLAWRNLIPGLSRLIYEPTRLQDYGGGGEELSRTYARAVHGLELFRHLGGEIRNMPRALFHYRSLKRQARYSRDSLI